MKVAVALIIDPDQRILITQRPLHVPHGGLWEFPGGKLEAGEIPEAALIREIKEEVGIDILAYSFLGEINHDYESNALDLLLFHVQKYQGEARCCEKQIALRWVLHSDLPNYRFPEANKRIIALVQACLVQQNEQGFFS